MELPVEPAQLWERATQMIRGICWFPSTGEACLTVYRLLERWLGWRWRGKEPWQRSIKVEWFGEPLQQFKYSRSLPACAAAGEARVMQVHLQRCPPGPPAEVREDSWEQQLTTTVKFCGPSFGFAFYPNAWMQATPSTAKGVSRGM